MYVEGFKQEINTDLVDVGSFYKDIEAQVYEKRCMDMYGMDINCYECHKPMQIDSRKILKTHRIPNTVLFCHDCKKENVKYHRDPIFIKKKNNLLSFFKKLILDDSMEKLPKFIREMGS